MRGAQRSCSSFKDGELEAESFSAGLEEDDLEGTPMGTVDDAGEIEEVTPGGSEDWREI